MWNISKREIVSQLIGHKYGVQCIQFSPDSSVLVSVGYQVSCLIKQLSAKGDGKIVVWDWKDKIELSVQEFKTQVGFII